MKQITREMERKYGCLYCLDLVTENYYRQKRYKCKHDSCPYTELEAYKSYEDYYKSKGDDHYGMGI